MANIPLTSSGGLFTRLGHIAGWTNDLESISGGTATTNVLVAGQVPTRTAQLEADYAASVADYTDIDGIVSLASQLQQTPQSFLSYLQQLASNTLITMANLSVPLIVLDVPHALTLLIGQMNSASASVNSSTPSTGAQTNFGSPVGNPIFVWSEKDGAGRTLQYVIPETVYVTMTSDSQSGAVAGQEPYAVQGQNPQPNTLAYNWLGSQFGSGAAISGNLVPGNVSNASGNLLVNSDFTTFTTTNVPDNWTILIGAAGTDIFNGTTTNAYTTGGGSVQFTGTGAALDDAICQVFNTPSSTTVGAGGTPATVLAGAVNNAQYAFNLWLKVSATPSAGVVEVAFINGSNTIIQDDQGNNQAVTMSLTAVSTSFVNFNGVLRLPQVLPSTIKIRLRLSTAIDSGKSVYFGRFGMTQMSQFYSNGPYVAGFSGNTNVNASGLTPDAWTFAISNTFGAFQKAFYRWFIANNPGFILPNSGSPTISDSLVA
jgi:hypothetical protein